MLALFRLAAELDLPVQIVREIQDQRMHWMHTVPPVSNADFDWLFSALGSQELPAWLGAKKALTRALRP